MQHTQVSLAAAHLIESAVVTNYVKFGSRTLLTRTRRVVHDAVFERGWQCDGRTVLWISRRVGHCHSRLVANEVEVLALLTEKTSRTDLRLAIYDVRLAWLRGSRRAFSRRASCNAAGR